MKLKMTKLVGYDGVGFVFDCGDAVDVADEVENVIAVVSDNETMNEDLDEKGNVNSNLTKMDAWGRSIGYANTQVHVFVNDMQMND